MAKDKLVEQFVQDEIEAGHTIDRMCEAAELGLIGYGEYERMTIQEMEDWLEFKEEI